MALKANFVRTAPFETADLSDSAQDEKDPISIKAYRFAGASDEVALILGGVHAKTEVEGVNLAKSIFDELSRLAIQKKVPAFTTVVVPQLFQIGRYGGVVTKNGKRVDDNSRRVPIFDEKATDKPRTWRDTNRNFPQPGESYSYVRERAAREKRKDNQLAWPSELACACHGGSLGRMMGENRILVQLVELLRPVRIASLHQHGFKTDKAKRTRRRGDEPGLFVDPRGGFDEGSDLAYTREGAEDDQLAQDMLNDALGRVTADLSPHPFRGNISTPDGQEDAGNATVHYSFDAVHDPGTSFGTWAPWPPRVVGDGPPLRPGTPVVTVEIPQSYTKVPLASVKAIHQAVLLKHFLKI